MNQRTCIVVLPNVESQLVLETAHELLAGGGFPKHVRELITRDRVIFFSEHLDLWSMWDTFDRFLRPRNQVQLFNGGSSMLYAISLERLTIRQTARDLEESLFRSLLIAAKTYDRRDRDGFLFVLREVFCHVRDETPGALPGLSG